MPLMEAELGELTARVWETVLGFKPSPAAGDGGLEARREVLIGTVTFTGAWEGVLSLFCPVLLAREAAAVIFEIDSLSTTIPQAAETIGELTNISGGNLKPVLPPPVDLGLPIVTIGDHMTQILPGEELVKRIYLDCRGHRMEVRLTKRRK